MFSCCWFIQDLGEAFQTSPNCMSEPMYVSSDLRGLDDPQVGEKAVSVAIGFECTASKCHTALIPLVLRCPLGRKYLVIVLELVKGCFVN